MCVCVFVCVCVSLCESLSRSGYCILVIPAIIICLY